MFWIKHELLTPIARRRPPMSLANFFVLCFGTSKAKQNKKTKQNLSKFTLVLNLINCTHVRTHCLARIIIVIARNNKRSIIWIARSWYRHLVDGNVNCAGSATYQICFRLPILNPNPITDPNPNINKNKQNDTGMKLNIVISKSRFPRDGVGL